MKRTLALSALALLLLSIGTANTQTITAAPTTMNFQGRLAKPDGTPVSDGTHTLTFRIYDTQLNGNVKWAEQIGSVVVRNGIFSALLGKVFPFNDTVLNGNPYLEIQVDNEVPLLPRQQFQSVAFALKANTVPDNAITTAKVADAAITTAKIADGSVTAAKLAPGVGGGASGAAGGDLTGTYPNPLLALGSVTSAKLASDANSLEKVSGGTLINISDTIDLRGQRQIGSSPAADAFTYQNRSFGNYALGWEPDTWQTTGYTAWLSGNNGIKFFTDRTPRLSVTAGGSVGIGTTAPTSSLTVAGAVESTTGGFKFPDGTVQTTASGGVPTGYMIIGSTSTVPAGYTFIGSFVAHIQETNDGKILYLFVKN